MYNYLPHIDYILNLAKSEGCKVRLYDREHFVEGVGRFDDGIMNIAYRHKDKKYLFYVVVHELQHFRQWKKDRLMFKRETLKKDLACEYDAEKRTVKFVKRYGKVKFNEDDEKKYIRTANKYMQMIKWHYRHNRNKWIIKASGVEEIKVTGRWLTKKELYAKISKEDMEIFDKHYMNMEGKRHV